LPRWRDSERPEQRNVDTIVDHTTLGVDRVTYNSRINRSDERYGDDRIVQKVAHKGKQILIRKRFRIE
jgi:hypothetical protein